MAKKSITLQSLKYDSDEIKITKGKTNLIFRVLIDNTGNEFKVPIKEIKEFIK